MIKRRKDDLRVDYVAKKCSKCKKQKPIDSFAKKKTRKDGRASECKECHNIVRKKYYVNNKEKEIQRVTERKRELTTWLRSLKEGKKCVKCPENDPVCLDFHHTDGDKDMTVAHTAWNGWSRSRILKEIEKCVILCANCHRKEHKTRV